MPSTSREAAPRTESRKASSGPANCGIERPNAAEFAKASLRGTLCGFQHPRTPGEGELRRLAGRQHGALHRRQLRAAGVGPRALHSRIEDGRLTRLHSDVFLYESASPDRLGLMFAAALHYRGDAVLCGRSACEVWDVVEAGAEAAGIELLLVGRSTTPVGDVTLHRTAHLDPRDVRWHRSVLDLCGSAGLVEAESALAMLRHRGLVPERELEQAYARLPPNHRGIALARQLLDAPPEELTLTRSHYERQLRALIGRAQLTRPVANLVVAGYERDLVWPAHRLIVEFDGWIFHRDRFREDRRRDASAVAAGYAVIRLTADRVDHCPEAVIAELAAALAVRTADPAPPREYA